MKRHKLIESEQVLKFWFEEISPNQWWKKDTEFDGVIRARFLECLQYASAGELFHWRETPRGRLAEIIVLDQFSRNIFREAPKAFAQDNLALILAQEAVSSEAHRKLKPVECGFLMMPYMHSESRVIHEQAESLFKQFAPHENYKFELRHKAIIDRFGRYPHRNEILGRCSTPEEIEFLRQPGSKF